MTPDYNTFRPNGFSSLNPYLFVSDAEEYISFLKDVFKAEEKNRTMRPETDVIANVILQIGDTSFMISEASEPFLDMRTSFYLYVENVDEVYNYAIENGASSVFPPAAQSFGDRQGGIVDMKGNYWWISKRLSDEEYTTHA